jgi:uncharacterized membrane protein
MKKIFTSLIVLFIAFGFSFGVVQKATAATSYMFTDIDVPGFSYTVAYDINDEGVIVGYYFEMFVGIRGFLYDGTDYITLSVPGAPFGYARGINNTGEIVGTYFSGGTAHGYLYDGTTYTTIDVPGARDSYASGINDNGYIVGSTINPTQGYLYDGTTFTPLDFRTSRFGGTSAYDINDSGNIVGRY